MTTTETLDALEPTALEIDEDLARRTASALISRSQSHTEIVHAPLSPELHEELAGLADDWIDGNEGTREYWADADDRTDSPAWRVHLDDV